MRQMGLEPLPAYPALPHSVSPPFAKEKELKRLARRHSWSDSPQNKWRMLKAWATQFEKQNGRSPVVWLDKVGRACTCMRLQ